MSPPNLNPPSSTKLPGGPPALEPIELSLDPQPDGANPPAAPPTRVQSRPTNGPTAAPPPPRSAVETVNLSATETAKVPPTRRAANAAPVAAGGISLKIDPHDLENGRPRADWKTGIITAFVSFTVHTLALLACSLIALDAKQLETIVTTLAKVTDPIPEDPIAESTAFQPEKIDTTSGDSNPNETAAEVISDYRSPIDMNVSDAPPTIALDAMDTGAAAPNIKIGNITQGRTGQMKAALIKSEGGSKESEAAVASGLAWLKKRQLEDGSWSFDHTQCVDCKTNACDGAGAMADLRTAATGAALLAFLGGGHTHKSGDFKLVVEKGLDALLKMGKTVPDGLDLRGEARDSQAHGRMYAHGIATIALCEAAGLTKDPKYAKPAYNAVRFTLAAQDPKGGGWRYEPRQKGDTSVVGWQVMALKSAQNAQMKVAPRHFKGVEQFLENVQVEGGARYGYDQAAPGSPAVTAVGLLCRMYLGWDQKNPALIKGVDFLDKTKPSPNDMYYNYYATQVMHHYGGDPWNRWNRVMRDQLVTTQLRNGPEAGSWPPSGDMCGGSGGRVLTTCLSVMTLEVYYRFLPIYNRDKLKVTF